MIDMLVVSHATFRAVNRSVYNLLHQVYGLQVEITVPRELPFSGKILEADPAQERDVPLHFLSLKGNNPRTYDFEGLYALADQLQPKVIYLENDPVSLQAVRLGRWCKGHQVQLICLSCENLDFGPVSSFQRNGWRGILTGLFKLGLVWAGRSGVNHVFTINDAGTRIFKKYGYKSVKKTPLGFNPDLFYASDADRSAARAELGIEHLFAIAYIGRLVPEKGVDLLLRALKSMEELPWVFIIDKFEASPGSYQHQIAEQIKQLGLESRIKYFDAPHATIAKYMNAADLVVIPSVSTPKWVEQYGRVAPESMACGKLVLASNSGALPELIGDAGLLFNEGDVEALAAQIRSVLLHPEKYAVLAQKAAERAHTHLSIKQQAAICFETIHVKKQ